MTLYQDVYPSNDEPNKSQIEGMYYCGLTFHGPNFVLPTDYSDFGLGFSSLASTGVVMDADTRKQLRRHVPSLWSRLGYKAQIFFQLRHLLPGLAYCRHILTSIDQIGSAAGAKPGSKLSLDRELSDMSGLVLHWFIALEPPLNHEAVINLCRILFEKPAK